MCDVLTAEDKTRTCSAKDLGECIDKATTLREKTLDAWQRRLPFANLIEKFDVMSVLWHERTLTVYQTSKIKDTFFHYKVMTATLQDTPGGYTHLARLLMALISLKVCGQRVAKLTVTDIVLSVMSCTTTNVRYKSKNIYSIKHCGMDRGHLTISMLKMIVSS